jgi:hypothetical protein
VQSDSFTESATENIPPAKQHGDIAQENLRDVFQLLASFGVTASRSRRGKGEKVG